MTEPEISVPRRSAPAHSAHRQRGLRSLWASISEWRNWRLPVKVAAVLAVPAIAAVTLGAIQVRADVQRASSFANIQKLIELRNALIPLTNDLQTERWVATRKVVDRAPFSVATLQHVATTVDHDAATVTSLGTRLDPMSPAGIRYQALIGQFGGLPVLHAQAVTGTADVVTLISSFSQVIDTSLDLEQALVPQLADPALTGLALSLNDLEVAQEQVRVEEATGTVALTGGTLTDTQLTDMQASEVRLTDRLGDFQIAVTPDQLAEFQQQEITDDLSIREQTAQQILTLGKIQQVAGGSQGILTFGVTPNSWVAASDSASNQLSHIAGQFADDLRTTSASLQDQASSAAGIESVVLFAILLLAVGFGVIVGRHLLRSLGILRRTALDVAEYRLPEVVAAIDRGELSEHAIDPVPVHTHEELGQLARAFDAVHGQAVRSAVGQATLRSNLRSVFVNLSRRSQSLVERQLRLMERLERNEEDPQQLANLFKLDHLATRMRRNNENLMVLSGDDPARRAGGPLPLADVVRAAVSEIEHYQRVVVRSTPSADVLGYAAGDLTRLLAELLDNATSFSPPQAQVFIGGRSFTDGSVRLEIRDEGIGIAAAELIDANAKLDAGDSPDVPVSRQMGLYVVGRLARRHGIRVVLETPPDGGLLAVVQVPAELVKLGPAPRQSPALPIGTPSFAGLLDTLSPPQNGSNGHTTSSGNGVNGHTSVAAEVLGTPLVPDSGSEWAAFRGSTIRDLESDPHLAPTDFTWFIPEFTPDEAEPPRSIPPSPAPPPAQAAQPPSVPMAPATDGSATYAYTGAGLPRRVPRAHAVPSLAQRPAPAPEPAAPPAPSRTGTRNPSRARGFLNDYQSGIRQGTRTRQETPELAEPMENGTGEDR